MSKGHVQKIQLCISICASGGGWFETFHRPHPLSRCDIRQDEFKTGHVAIDEVGDTGPMVRINSMKLLPTWLPMLNKLVM